MASECIGFLESMTDFDTSCFLAASFSKLNSVNLWEGFDPSLKVRKAYNLESMEDGSVWAWLSRSREKGCSTSWDTFFLWEGLEEDRVLDFHLEKRSRSWAFLRIWFSFEVL